VRVRGGVLSIIRLQRLDSERIQLVDRQETGTKVNEVGSLASNAPRSRQVPFDNSNHFCGWSVGVRLAFQAGTGGFEPHRPLH
jgi:hypothetical protein